MTDNQLYLLLTKPSNRRSFGCDGKTIWESDTVTVKRGATYRRSATNKRWYTETSLIFAMMGISP